MFMNKLLAREKERMNELQSRLASALCSFEKNTPSARRVLSALRKRRNGGCQAFCRVVGNLGDAEKYEFEFFEYVVVVRDKT